MRDRHLAAILVGLVLIAGCGMPSPPASSPTRSAAGSTAPTSTESPVHESPSTAARPSLPAIGGSWTRGVSVPTRLGENAAVAIDGVIYLAGGLDNHAVSLRTFLAFDTRTAAWAALPDLPEGRDHIGLTAVDGRIYVTGGGLFAAPAVRSGLWRYDPPERRWTALAPMPAARWQHAAVALDGRIYVVGGVVKDRDSREVWAYDIASGVWHTDLARLPTEREHLTAVAADGLVIAIGGRKGRQIGAVEAYDPNTDTWRSLPDLPTPRGGSAAGLIGDVIHVAGGENLNDASTYREHEALDMATMTWARGPDLPTKRHGVASAVVDGHWYVIGGGRAAGLSVSDVVEIYSP